MRRKFAFSSFLGVTLFRIFQKKPQQNKEGKREAQADQREKGRNREMDNWEGKEEGK